MSAIKDLVQEIKRALEKPTEAEREIALRVVEEQAAKKLKELETMAKEQAVKTIDDLILDCMSAPGWRSEYEGMSQQDTLVILRGKVQSRVGLEFTGIQTSDVEQRAKRNVYRTPRDPRHEAKKARTGKGG